MYILQISDMHLSTESNMGDLINKVNLLSVKIKELNNEKNSQIVCCVLGRLGTAKNFV